jgi:hypothetical protein
MMMLRKVRKQRLLTSTWRIKRFPLLRRAKKERLVRAGSPKLLKRLSHLQLVPLRNLRAGRL